MSNHRIHQLTSYLHQLDQKLSLAHPTDPTDPSKPKRSPSPFPPGSKAQALHHATEIREHLRYLQEALKNNDREVAATVCSDLVALAGEIQDVLGVYR